MKKSLDGNFNCKRGRSKYGQLLCFLQFEFVKNYIGDSILS